MTPSVQVVIPTLNRPAGLARILGSIERHSPGTECIISHEKGALPLIINGLFAVTTADIVIWAGDSCEWTADCAGICAAAMVEHFPDLDGCLGLYQENLPPVENCHEFCFMAVGRRFIDRFPGAAIFCPLYEHMWADAEFGLFAKSLGRFHHEIRATVKHWIAGVTEACEPDETHHLSRRRVRQDELLGTARTRLGIMWGNQFDRADAPPRIITKIRAGRAPEPSA